MSQSETIVFSFDFSPGDGGIARLCSEIAVHLGRRDRPLRVLTQRYPDQLTSHPSYARLRTERLSPQRPGREKAALMALRGHRGPVLSGIVYPEGLIARMACRGPRVVLAHGTELLPHSNPFLRPVWRVMKRKVFEDADLVIANSHHTASMVRHLAPSATVEALPLAVDPVRFTPANAQMKTEARRRWGVGDHQHAFCTVGRVHGYKAHDLVLKALAAQDPEIRAQLCYLVAGKGPALEDLKQLAEQLGVQDQVRWLGFVPEEALCSVYHAADLFVLCTRDDARVAAFEGFGLVFLEAQACGVPVVGARTGGIPDAIEEGQGGWLIAQDDLDALSEHLSGLVLQPALYQNAGKRARDRVEAACTWEHYSVTLEALLLAHNVL